MIRFIVSALLLSLATVAHAKDQLNTLTHGMAQMYLRVGLTTQSEVLETFGGPNVTTLDGDGREVWVYDRFATVTASKDSGFSIGMLIGGAGGTSAEVPD